MFNIIWTYCYIVIEGVMLLLLCLPYFTKSSVWEISGQSRLSRYETTNVLTVIPCVIV